VRDALNGSSLQFTFLSIVASTNWHNNRQRE